MYDDKITIKGLHVYAYHGALEEEKKIGQRFYIDAVLYLNTQRAGLNDNLVHSVHYGEVSEYIIKSFTHQTFDLIETAAEQLATGILNHFKCVHKVEITVHKPSAPVPLLMDDIAVSIVRMRHQSTIALGSNIDDKEQFLKNAIDALKASSYCHITKVSSFYETDPVGFADQDKFLNAIVCIETYLEPHALLCFLQDIEQQNKRERLIHWGPRTLDLDIIFYDDMIFQDEVLTLPHPFAHLRRFVMEPLAEIDPHRMHPRLHKTITEILDDLSRKENICQS